MVKLGLNLTKSSEVLNVPFCGLQLGVQQINHSLRNGHMHMGSNPTKDGRLLGIAQHRSHKSEGHGFRYSKSEHFLSYF